MAWRGGHKYQLSVKFPETTTVVPPCTSEPYEGRLLVTCADLSYPGSVPLDLADGDDKIKQPRNRHPPPAAPPIKHWLLSPLLYRAH